MSNQPTHFVCPKCGATARVFVTAEAVTCHRVREHPRPKVVVMVERQPKAGREGRG